ncbi:hypothetical protein SLS59_010078 [Nothophoma quercina]|uniref:Apple domain-containing protein n=1 Tax=Nothophoma quercina TaxID=749835 RepID=A0ABR3QI25_9PLEO
MKITFALISSLLALQPTAALQFGKADTDITTTTLFQTSTSTFDVTTTVSSTSTVTSTSTSTATVTYSTSANFLPLASSAAYIAAAGGASRRDVPLAFTPNRPVVARGAPLCSVGANTKNPQNPPKMYPGSVSCVVQKQIINVIKSTVTRTKTVAARTSTISSTTTLVSTSTVLQTPASSTVTETVSTSAVATNTVSVTTTATETFSTTVAAATPAAYFPQCQDNNIKSRAGAKSFVSFYAFSSIQTVTGVSSAELCCQNCALNSACSSFAWFPSGACYLITSGADCSANPPPVVVSSQAINNGANGYVVGNGNCGQVRVTGTL